MKKPYLIAEIGINHNGSLTEAKKLILLAKKSNFDAVKFQKRDLNICIPDDQKNIQRETPWGLMTYLEYKKKIELSYNQFKELKVFAKKNKIEMFTSSWDIQSQKMMSKLNFKYNKIASAMITNIKLVEEVARERKKTFISTGMSNYKDIDKAIRIFKKNKCPFVLMHCVSVYPCDENLLNLKMILTLKKKYKCVVGYSGHESSVSPSIIAYMLGASYIERHITLNRSNWGTDQSASLEESGMRYLSSVLKKIPSILGDGKKRILKNEKKVLKKMKYW
jgi:N-acetylneuraminate synthase